MCATISRRALAPVVSALQLNVRFEVSRTGANARRLMGTGTNPAEAFAMNRWLSLSHGLSMGLSCREILVGGVRGAMVRRLRSHFWNSGTVIGLTTMSSF